ncbi:MAG TPA: DNA-3-methyladenine glycosylase 2 family protein [Hyphomicrobiaceae bacterium]|nr:DNA-3-methyladenine glycosylase 2 family protein [Hyphomicrobiaceae bacterium]
MRDRPVPIHAEPSPTALDHQASMPRAASPRLIASEADVKAGLRALRRKCPAMRLAHDLAGDPPLRLREPGLEGLMRIIVAQQVSVASATAIWARVAAGVRPLEAATILAMSEEQLRACGLSRPKIRTLTAIARAISEDGLDLGALADASEAEIHEQLTAVSGIGPWTADIFAMFCLGRADAFAAGDLALQEAARLILELDERPKPDELGEIAERWRPWRGVAARMLWQYYRVAKAASSGAPA